MNLTGKYEAKYAYYRRCQVLRKNGEQCKAPAVKGEPICYSHAAQRETAQRRQQQRLAVLERVAEQMREVMGREFGLDEVFSDYRAIQKTIAMAAQALIDGRMDCKSAGRLAVELQTAMRNLVIGRSGDRVIGQKGVIEQEGNRFQKASKTAGRSQTTKILLVPPLKGARLDFALLPTLPPSFASTPSRQNRACWGPRRARSAPGWADFLTGLRPCASQEKQSRAPESIAESSRRHGARQVVVDGAPEMRAGQVAEEDGRGQSWFNQRGHRGTRRQESISKWRRSAGRERRAPGGGRRHAAPMRSSARGGRNKPRHSLNPIGLRFSPQFSPRFWHNGEALVLLWTSAELCLLLKGGTPS